MEEEKKPLMEGEDMEIKFLEFEVFIFLIWKTKWKKRKRKKRRREVGGEKRREEGRRVGRHSRGR